MYADRITDSMRRAIDETDRRRERQIAYNTEYGIDPTPLQKKIADITDQLAREDADTAELLQGMGGLATGFQYGKGHRGYTSFDSDEGEDSTGKKRSNKSLAAQTPAKDLTDLIAQLTGQMHHAAEELNFEVAARLRDEIGELKKELRQMQNAGHA